MLSIASRVGSRTAWVWQTRMMPCLCHGTMRNILHRAGQRCQGQPWGSCQHHQWVEDPAGSPKGPGVPFLVNSQILLNMNGEQNGLGDQGKAGMLGFLPPITQDKGFAIAKALVHNRLSSAFPLWVVACFRMCKTRLESLVLLLMKHQVTLQGCY